MSFSAILSFPSAISLFRAALQPLLALNYYKQQTIPLHTQTQSGINNNVHILSSFFISLLDGMKGVSGMTVPEQTLQIPAFGCPPSCRRSI